MSDVLSIVNRCNNDYQKKSRTGLTESDFKRESDKKVGKKNS
jgi:hypothetical protein